MSPSAVAAPYATIKYTIGDIRMSPDLFLGEEEVVVTEKIHGTMLQITVVPASQSNPRFYKGRVAISNKELGAQGLVLDHNDQNNLYVQAALKHDLFEKTLALFEDFTDDWGTITILGEVFGTLPSGEPIQDYTYGDEVLGFRAFDVWVGGRDRGTFYPWEIFVAICQSMDVPYVPVVYRGPYHPRIVASLALGPTLAAGAVSSAPHMREGVVVKLAEEARHSTRGRKIAKHLNDACPKAP